MLADENGQTKHVKAKAKPASKAKAATKASTKTKASKTTPKAKTSKASAKQKHHDCSQPGRHQLINCLLAADTTASAAKATEAAAAKGQSRSESQGFGEHQSRA